MREESGRGVRAGEQTLEERLREYPELRAWFEEMLAIVENAAGDIVKADEAEQRVIEELRALGQSALQGWAERNQRRVQKQSEQQVGVSRKVKKLYWYSRLGQVEIEEQIYQRGGRQWRPFSESAGVSCRSYSLGLQRAVTDFGADVAFGKVPQKLREHYGIEVPISAAQTITKQDGAAIKQEQVRLARLPRGGVQQLIGKLDGSMLPIVSIGARTDKSAPWDGRKRRQLSWREARLSLVRAVDKAKGR